MLQFRKKLSGENLFGGEGLKGRVKSITNFADEAKKIPLLSAEFNENGNVTQWTIIPFAEKEILIYDLMRWKTHHLKGKNIERNEFFYDENNNRIECHQENDEHFAKYISKYDENRNEIECGQYDKNGECLQKYLYQYDEKNRLIEQELLVADQENPRTQKVMYQYDNQGNCVEEQTFENGILHNITLIKYDEKGRKISLNQEFEDKDIINKTFWEYDEMGNVIKEENLQSFTGEADTTHRITTYEYQYDKHGNWIKQTTYSGTSKKVSETNFREIVYFD